MPGLNQILKSNIALAWYVVKLQGKHCKRDFGEDKKHVHLSAFAYDKYKSSKSLGTQQCKCQ
jgi:hypothetical protein